MSVLLETNLALPLFRRGKVRDVYDLGDKLLIVSTDRISAFDVVLPCGIPDKGRVLNQLSAFWFEKTAHILPNHLIKVIDSNVVLNEVKNLLSQPGELPDSLIGRSMLVAKGERIPVECVVRGYLSGSAWAEYKETGKVGDISLPRGIKESQELPQSIFTPTTKSDTEHDRPLTKQDIKGLGIEGLFGELEQKSLLIYCYARDYAKRRGIIIADTKFEFGFIKGKLALIDELLTPDSSRFWDAGQYKVGHSQPSFDKQPVRDWLLASGWDKEPPAPMLPPEVIESTSKRYREVYSKLTGGVLRGK
ncbi:MAG: phosphoribosylaminoimidazolesuccinocarboxamide synthase [Dehalococcoidia bacterium]|nr:phosphoribosylaminoimidazolesuccinocarboxamide synthase [Dehalococcoidia bacterium]